MDNIKISIHAPTRGATELDEEEDVDIKFQSTLPREERLFEVKNLGKVLLFQSTLPREERHRGNRRRSDCYNFNPRSHERSDEVEAKRKAKLEISIHAPTRGATAILHKKFVYFYTIPTINI